MGEAEEAVEGHPGREQLNESFKFRDLEQLNEEFGSHGAAQTDTEMEQLIGAPERDDLKIVYRKYIKTRQKVATIEEQLQTHDLLWFVMVPLDFWKPQTGLAETLVELNILKS